MLDPVFQALADPTRRDILELLRAGDRATGVISSEFTLSRPTISKHLRVLVDADLIDRRKSGRNWLYELRPAPLAEAYDWIGSYRSFWRDNLDSLERHLAAEMAEMAEMADRADAAPAAGAESGGPWKP